MPIQSPPHNLICAEVLSDQATHPRPAATRAHLECGSKRRRVSEPESPAVESAASCPKLAPGRRQWHSAPKNDAREQEMRLMLRVQATGKSALRLCSGHPLRTMPDKDLEYIRDHGVALQVMASNTLAVSSRTFFLAACIYDKFLAATVRVASAAEKPPHDALDQGEADFFVVEAPLACFIIACKFCETFAPRLADVAAIEGAGCSVHDLYNAENFVLERLGWDIDILTALDILHKLLEFATPGCAARIKSKAEYAMKISICNYSLRNFNASDMAVGILLLVEQEFSTEEEIENIVPAFMITPSAHAFHAQLRRYIAEKVGPRRLQMESVDVL